MDVGKAFGMRWEGGSNGRGYMYIWGLPGGASGKGPACQCRRCKRCRFDPWVGKIPWRRARQPTPVFLPGESPWTEEPVGLQSMGSLRVGYDWSDLARTGVCVCVCVCVYIYIWFTLLYSRNSHSIVKQLYASKKNKTSLKQHLGFPGGPVVQNPPCSAEDTSLIPGPGRSHMPWGREALALQLPKPVHPRALAPQQEKHRSEKPMHRN